MIFVSPLAKSPVYPAVITIMMMFPIFCMYPSVLVKTVSVLVLNKNEKQQKQKEQRPWLLVTNLHVQV